MTEAAHTITWEELCAAPSLQDLPYKMELNGRNQIVLVPASSQHSIFQGLILRLLNRLLDAGMSIPELAVMTADNVKAPDVVWASNETIRAHAGERGGPWSSAPELCVEVLSPSSTLAEIEQKRTLYLEAGAREVWVCGLKGGMEFYAPDGRLERSALCPAFPAQAAL